jgi:hypothetical protein
MFDFRQIQGKQVSKIFCFQENDKINVHTMTIPFKTKISSKYAQILNANIIFLPAQHFFLYFWTRSAPARASACLVWVNCATRFVGRLDSG